MQMRAERPRRFAFAFFGLRFTLSLRAGCCVDRMRPPSIPVPETGSGVVPKHESQRVLTNVQELDETEHRTCPFNEKCKPVKRCIDEFGRI